MASQAKIEVLDSTDLVEMANGADVPLGTIMLEFGQVTDEEFLADPSIFGYCTSEHLGGDWFYRTTDSNYKIVFSHIAECLVNQDEGTVSEFVIPISKEDRIYLYVVIGNIPA